MKWRLRFLADKEEQQADQELEILKEDVIEAYNFVNKNKENIFENKKNIPIYLILGPARFGKTTILSQSGLDLIDFNKESFEKVMPTKYCSFWFTKDAIYIDTAGNYTKPDATKPRNDLIWQGFIKLLKKYFGKDSIAGVLIILDLPAISQDKDLLNKSLFCVRERIYELASLTKKLHIHVIFTKCDRLSGFLEFFSQINAKERKKPFGISFTFNKKAALIIKFETKFNQLLENLNNIVIENFQKSSQIKNRSQVKAFPSQLDHLREIFIEVLNKIPNSAKILLSGFYFTSSIQDGTLINPIKNTITQTLNLKEKPTYKLESRGNNSYFVEEIFKKTILPKTEEIKKKIWFKLPYIQIRYVCSFIIAALIISTSAVTGYKNYKKSTVAINKTNAILSNKEKPNHNDLHEIINQIKPNKKSWWFTLGTDKTKTLYKSLSKAHQTIFTQSLITQLENDLKENIYSQDPEKLHFLYETLKAYLMFGNNKQIDNAYIKAWFTNFWSKTNNKKEIDNLQKQLKAILQNKIKTSLNDELIAVVNSNFKNALPSQKLYLLLQNKYANQKINVGNKVSISKLYTKENFYKAYKKQIPDLVNNPPKHDITLGKINLHSNNKQAVIKKIQEIYTKKYVAAWKDALNKETEKEFKNLEEISEYLNNTSKTDSRLLKLLKLTKQNIDIKNPPKELTEKILINLQGVKTINLAHLQKDLQNAAHYITNIIQNKNPSESAFVATSFYLQNGSSKNPIAALNSLAENSQSHWLKKYLKNLTTNIWQMLLKSTHAYIRQAWNQQVISEYNKNIANKYPIFKNSKDDLSLDEFTKFFGANGVIEDFYRKYIDPFVNTKKTEWAWKKIDNQEINFSQDFLEVFLRASMIQKMFFTSRTPKPKLRFSLTPLAMTPNTQSFSLHIDGQKISFANHENKKTHNLVWPGPQPGSVTISFVNNEGKYFTTSEFETWAWFRVLDKSNVTSSKNTRRFELAFNLNGNTAKYLLTTPDPVNPFIPDVINNFRCE